MRVARSIWVLFTAAALLVPTAAFSADGTPLGLGVGVALPQGSGSGGWNSGFTLSLHSFSAPSRSVAIGGYLAYSRWTPDARWGSGGDVTGHAEVLEAVPSLRVVAPLSGTPQAQLFGQIGFGLFFLHRECESTSWGNCCVLHSTDYTTATYGLTFGAGFSTEVGPVMLDVLPLYRIVFTEAEATKYLSVSLTAAVR